MTINIFNLEITCAIAEDRDQNVTLKPSELRHLLDANKRLVKVCRSALASLHSFRLRIGGPLVEASEEICEELRTAIRQASYD